MQNNSTPFKRIFNINLDLITPIVRTKYGRDNRESVIRHFFNKNFPFLIAFGQTPPLGGGKIKSPNSTESREKIWMKTGKDNKNIFEKRERRDNKTVDCDLPDQWAALRAARQVGTSVRLYKLARTYFIKGG